MKKREKPLVSIVIPSWFEFGQNGKYGHHETYWFAVACILRLQEVTPRDQYELIIVDNGSTLETKDLSEAESLTDFPIEKYWSKADVLIRNQNNLGFAPSCNQAFALARGEYICCMNNDVLVWDGWLDAMIEPFNLDWIEPKTGVSMPALMKQTGNANEALKLKEIDLTTNKNKFGVGEFGSLWMAKKEILDKLIEKDGYVFDEDFKLGMGEDRDLWDRIRLLGLETYRTHNTRVFHQGNMTIGKVKDRKKYTEKNREYLEEKRKIRKNN